MKRIVYSQAFFAALLSLLLFSCKKENSNGTNNQNPSSGNQQLSDADSLKYLMYRIMQKSFVDGGRDTHYDLPTYYWYNQVPALDPLSSSYADAPALLAQMKTYPKDANGKNIDKYSFLDNGQVSQEIQQGVGGDKGLEVSYAYDANNNIVLVVLYADKNSPSGVQGVQRGWTITSINNMPVAYDGSNGTNVKRVINAVYNDPSGQFTFKKADGTSVNLTIASSQYQINPVLFDTVFNVGGKNVGYFVFYTFSNITNKGVPTYTQQELNRVFNKFSNANISNLIVDLRYNGGGSVNTAEFLDSMMAPATVAGKEMYHYLYNDKLTAQKSAVGLPDKVLFKAGGSLALQNVFFVVGKGTASASELTINNLKPYMNVQLVGDTTYGKPVGFFGFTISIFKKGVETDLADLYAINFETRNSLNLGGYFNGMIPDKIARDFIGYNWGSLSDDNLSKIFNFINTGTYGRTLPVSERLKQDLNLKMPIESTIRPLRFNGMISEKVSRAMQKVMNEKLKLQ